jgi:hypothetical protein
MESNSNLYAINTTIGAATQVGTTDSNGYETSVLLLENGTYYTGTGSGIATINVSAEVWQTITKESQRPHAFKAYERYDRSRNPWLRRTKAQD